MRKKNTKKDEMRDKRQEGEGKSQPQEGKWRSVRSIHTRHTHTHTTTHIQTTVARYNTALRVLRVWRCDLGGVVNAVAAASGELDHQPHPKTD